MEMLPTEDWETWTYEQCTLMLKRQSKHLHALLRLSQLLNFEYNKSDEAQLKLNEVIKQNREFEAAKVQELQGDIFMTMDDTKNMDRAVNHYKKSILFVANNFQLLVKLGKCFDRKREYKEAMQYYTKALMLSENDQGVIFRLGQAYYRMGDNDRGLYHMRRSFEQGPPMTANQLKLADILLKEGKPEQLNEA